jgi:hypothetical protein
VMKVRVIMHVAKTHFWMSRVWVVKRPTGMSLGVMPL